MMYTVHAREGDRTGELNRFLCILRRGQIVGCGEIGPYWGSETEGSLFNIHVLPKYQGKGVDRKLIETLEDTQRQCVHTMNSN